VLAGAGWVRKRALDLQAGDWLRSGNDATLPPAMAASGRLSDEKLNAERELRERDFKATVD